MYSTVSQRIPSVLATALIVLCGAVRSAHADEATCGPIANAYGPFDYRFARDSLRVVEEYHFTREVETLKSGKSGYIGGDLDYTLRASPNHYRALVSMMNLQFKDRTERPQGTLFSVPCYFDRAIRFVPDDGTVRTIFGVYLMRIGRTPDALKQFETAAKLGEDTGNLHYNLGLAYFEVHDYDKSNAEAQRAYGMGFSLPGLKEKLTKAGKWQPLPASNPAAAATPASALAPASGSIPTTAAPATAAPAPATLVPAPATPAPAPAPAPGSAP